MEPKYQIVVDGTDITNLLTNENKSILQDLTLTDKIGMTADTCSFSLAYDGSFKIPPTKGKIAVKIGYEPVQPRNPEIHYGIWLVGTYIVESVNFNKSRSSGKKLTVTGTSMPESPESALQSLQNSHIRYWQSYELEKTTFQKIVYEVCAGASLQAEIDEDLAMIEMPFTAQTGETDAEFLTKVSAVRDGKVKYNDNKVIIIKKDKTTLPEIPIDNNIQDILSLGYTTSSRNNIKRVEASYTDTDNKIVKISIGAGDPAYIIKGNRPDKKSAEDVAKTLLAHAQRQEEEITISLATHPNLRAETPIRLSNFETPINGLYIVYEVIHKLNKSAGLVSTVKAKKRVVV